MKPFIPSISPSIRLISKVLLFTFSLNAFAGEKTCNRESLP